MQCYVYQWIYHPSRHLCHYPLWLFFLSSYSLWCYLHFPNLVWYVPLIVMIIMVINIWLIIIIIRVFPILFKRTKWESVPQWNRTHQECSNDPPLSQNHPKYSFLIIIISLFHLCYYCVIISSFLIVVIIVRWNCHLQWSKPWQYDSHF